jgi:1,4-alpha-glucan branching enzyme
MIGGGLPTSARWPGINGFSPARSSCSWQLDWWLLQAGPYHQGLQRFVQDLNRLYLASPGLWQADYDYKGFYWLDCSDSESSVLAFARQDTGGDSQFAVLLNLTPVPRYRYRVGLPRAGKWCEVLNSDAAIYGGGNAGNLGGVLALEHKWHQQPYSAEVTLPPLSIIAFQLENAAIDGPLASASPASG